MTKVMCLTCVNRIEETKLPELCDQCIDEFKSKYSWFRRITN